VSGQEYLTHSAFANELNLLKVLLQNLTLEAYLLLRLLNFFFGDDSDLASILPAEALMP